MRIASLFFCAGLCVANSSHADQCSFIARAGGQVSQRSGDCVMQNDAEPKNGVERCTTREGVQIAQFTWKNGKREGAGWYVDYNDQRLEFNYRDDVPDGEGKIYDKTGQLKCSMNMEAGKARGTVRHFYPNGKLAQAWWFENGKQSDATIRLTAAGELMELRCAPRSFVAEDMQSCGHDGKESVVQLHDGKGEPLRGKLTYRNGKLIAQSSFDRKGQPLQRVFDPAGGERDYVDTVFHPNGKELRRYTVKEGRLHGQWQEFAEDGSVLEDSLYERDRKTKQILYFRNGNLKRTVAPAGDGKLLKVEEYWDSGKVRISGTYLEARDWNYLSAHGQVQEFREDGSLAADAAYVKGERHGLARIFHSNQKIAIESEYRRGELTKMICYDSAGEVQLTEEYFEDGSRKSISNLSTAEQRAAAGVCKAR